MALVSTLTISMVYLEDSGLYTCQSGFNSEANVTVIVISGTLCKIGFPTREFPPEISRGLSKNYHIKNIYPECLTRIPGKLFKLPDDFRFPEKQPGNGKPYCKLTCLPY